MPQAVTIESLPEAFEVIKEMQAEGYTWGEDYRPTSRAALARILEDGMAVSLDRHLREMARRGEADRRNGTYGRHLLTELGDIELCVPRTRRFSSFKVVRAYASPACSHSNRRLPTARFTRSFPSSGISGRAPTAWCGSAGSRSLEQTP